MTGSGGRGRPPLPRGALGDIRVRRQTLESGKWRISEDGPAGEGVRWEAAAGFRDRRGKRRRIRRYSVESAADAKRTLQAAWADEKVKLRLERPDSSQSVKELVELWWKDFEKSSNTRTQTKEQYRAAVDGYVIPTFGSLKVYELDPSTIHNGLEELADEALGRARFARVVLKHVGTFGVRSGVFETNPVTEDIALYKATHKAPQALTVGQYRDVRQAVSAWITEPHSGPARSTIVLDVLDFMVATGCRTGEALAVRWEDVQLGDSPSVTFAGTIVEPRKGRPTYRQEFTKTSSGFRTVPIGPMAVALLMRRAGSDEVNDHGMVFPNANGGLMAPNNFRFKLRRALKAADLEGFYPYLVRKTGAKLIRDAHGIEAASQTLGHSSTAVTEKHYAGAVHEAPDISHVLEGFLESARE